MTQAKADEEIALMRAIMADYADMTGALAVRDLSHSDIDRYRFEHPMVGPEPGRTAPMGAAASKCRSDARRDRPSACAALSAGAAARFMTCRTIRLTVGIM
jgi:hypothetical protein